MYVGVILFDAIAEHKQIGIPHVCGGDLMLIICTTRKSNHRP